MKVKLIAATLLMDEHSDEFLPYVKYRIFDASGRLKPREEWVENADELSEMADRIQHSHWDRDGESDTNKGYLKAAIAHEQFQIMEHASATFWISGISRSTAWAFDRYSFLSNTADHLENDKPTDILITGNHDMWRTVVRDNLRKGAPPKGRELAGLLLTHLKEMAPNTYQDFG